MKDIFSLKNKVAVVTGGSMGIGAMIAEGFLNFGAKVYLVARNADQLKAKQEALEHGYLRDATPVADAQKRGGLSVDGLVLSDGLTSATVSTVSTYLGDVKRMIRDPRAFAGVSGGRKNLSEMVVQNLSQSYLTGMPPSLLEFSMKSL